jgi:hypothetical protein
VPKLHGSLRSCGKAHRFCQLRPGGPNVQAPALDVRRTPRSGVLFTPACYNPGMSPAAKRIGLLILIAVCTGVGGVGCLGMAFLFAMIGYNCAFAAPPTQQTTTSPIHAWFGASGEWAFVFAAIYAVLAAAMITLAVMSVRSIRRVRRQLPDAGAYCAKCGYSLRGLPEPRCPECGTAFEAEGEKQ